MKISVIKKISIRIIYSDFYESGQSEILVSYSEIVDVDAIKYIYFS